MSYCNSLALPYYRPRSSLAKGPENLELMRLIDEEFLRHPFYGSRKMTAYLNCKGISVMQTDPTLDAFNGVGVSRSQAKH